MRKVIQGLMEKFGMMDASTLALDRFRLRDEIAARIQEHRERERKAAFQQLLLPGSPLTVDEGHTSKFKTMGYEPSRVYEGGFQFQKHYFGPKPGELHGKSRTVRSPKSFNAHSSLTACRKYSFGCAIFHGSRPRFGSKHRRIGSTPTLYAG